MEYYLIGQMLKEGLDCYMPLVDDGIDVVIRKPDGQYLQECVTNKTGKNVGKRSIWFNGYKVDKTIGKKIEYVYPRFEKYIATNFSHFKQVPAE